MLNSLISRGPAGGDLPREGWESLESRPPPFARPTLPSSLQPPSFVILSIPRDSWTVKSTRNEIEMFTVAGIASFPRLSLHCLHEARGYLDLLPPYLENSKFPSQGCTEGGRRKRKKKVVETFPLFESRTWIFCGVALRRDRFEEDLVSRKRKRGARGGRQKRGKRRKERKGRKEGRTKDDPACQLNGTELKSFALRQARHVLASWAWQSSGSSSPGFLSPSLLTAASV